MNLSILFTMNNYNRNYDDDRRNDYGVYGSGDYDPRYYHEPGNDIRGARSYETYPGDRGDQYRNREWREENDRNAFERMGNRIRNTWNDWTGSSADRNRWLNREHIHDYRGNFYPGNYEHQQGSYADDLYEARRRNYDRSYYENRRSERKDNDDRNIFERAGDAMKNFFRAPNADKYREYEGRQDYSQGFGNYTGDYGSYTGHHGLTGYNTGNQGRDNYTTDYNRHYREPGYDSSYRRDDVYSRRYDHPYYKK